MDDTHRYNFWLYIAQSETAPHIWVAHCLRLDVVSQGDTPAAAREAIEEAVQMVIVDDLNEGLDPLDRGPAPAHYFDALHKVVETGRSVDISAKDVAKREKVTRFASMMELQFMRVQAEESSPASFPVAYAVDNHQAA